MFPKSRAQNQPATNSVLFWRGELEAGRAVAVAATSGDLRQLVVTRHVHEQPVIAAGETH